MATTNGPHDNRSSGPRIGHETSGKSLRVMVVDGERLIRWSLATALEAQGHHVATAADADAALPALAAEPFDVVLLDCDSRDARDSEALDHIRLVSPHLPVVGMTAF